MKVNREGGAMKYEIYGGSVKIRKTVTVDEKLDLIIEMLVAIGERYDKKDIRFLGYIGGQEAYSSADIFEGLHEKISKADRGYGAKAVREK